jgi:hypothetical protein
LSGKLHKGLFGKKLRIVLELVVRNKLYDISLSVLAISVTKKGLVVAVKSLHVTEVGISNTDYDNSEWVA